MSQLASKIVPVDPLLYDTPLPYRRTFYPFGFAVAIATNHQSVIRAAEEAWGRLEKTHDDPPVELRIAVSESASGGRPPWRMPRGQGHLISYVHDPENFVHIDLRAGFAFGWLTNAVVADIYYLRYHFVESCASLMIESRHLAPIHAACIALDGKGVLLCGDSAAGKTTLAYSCARRGWTYVCDDGSELVRKSDNRVITGNPYDIRFRPHAKTLFPELAGYVPFERPNGKPSIELDTRALHLTIAESAPVECVVFLNRSNGVVWQGLTGYCREEAIDLLTRSVCVGEDSVREEQRTSIRRLLTAPLYEMQYHDLDWAEQRLRALIEYGE